MWDFPSKSGKTFSQENPHIIHLYQGIKGLLSLSYTTFCFLFWRLILTGWYGTLQKVII